MGSTESRLWDAVECDETEKVKKIMQKHPGIVDLPVAPGNLHTFFTRAVWRDNFIMMRAMLNHGADINAKGT